MNYVERAIQLALELGLDPSLPVNELQQALRDYLRFNDDRKGWELLGLLEGILFFFQNDFDPDTESLVDLQARLDPERINNLALEVTRVLEDDLGFSNSANLTLGQIERQTRSEMLKFSTNKNFWAEAWGWNQQLLILVVDSNTLLGDHLPTP